MMEYLINPIWFYFLGICDSLKTVATVIAVVSGVCYIVFIVAYFYERTEAILYELECDQEYAKLWKSCQKWCGVIFAVTLPCAIFCPDRPMLIGMQVASLATKGNIEWTVEQLKSVIDYIVECVKTLN